MSHIDNNDMNGGNKNIYPENGKPPTEWGSQYDPHVRYQIVQDIYMGKLTLEEMSEMLNVGRSHIKDWQRSHRPDVYGPPRRSRRSNYVSGYTRSTGTPGTFGKNLSKEQRRQITHAILRGEITLEAAAKKYRVYPSKLKQWCKSKTYASFTVDEVSGHKAAPSAEANKPDNLVERLICTPEYNRIVLDLLLNGLPDKALIVAKALTSTK